MPSIVEIAKKARTSIFTVHRVIHKIPGVKKATEERVKKAIKELGYTPNIFARNLKRGKPYIFGVVMPFPWQDTKFWESPEQAIQKAQKELENHKVKIRFFFYDRTSEDAFAEIKSQILNERLDGLLIAPVLIEQVRKLLAELPRGLPVVFFDSKIPDVHYLSSHCQDSYRGGLLSANLMKLLLPRGGAIAVINIIPRYAHIEKRIEGFSSFFRNDPAYTVKIFYLHSKNQDVESSQLTESILHQHSDVKGFFIAGGPCARFAEYLSANKLLDTIRIIGYDLTPENKLFLRKGAFDFIIGQSVDRQAYEGIYTLYKHCVLKEPVKKEIVVPIDIIIRENVDYYL